MKRIICKWNQRLLPLLITVMLFGSCVSAPKPPAQNEPSNAITTKPTQADAASMTGMGCEVTQKVYSDNLGVLVLDGALYYRGKKYEKGKQPVDIFTHKGAEEGRDIVQADGWVYQYFPLEPALYRAKTDGSKEEKLAEGTFSCPIIVGDWLYYRPDSGELWRMRMDGTGSEQITDFACDWPIISSDCIYLLRQPAADIPYGHPDEKAGVYAMNPDGSDCRQLLVGTFFSMYQHEDQLYLDTVQDSLLQFDVRTFEQKEILSYVNHFAVWDNQIYFADPQENDYLCCMDLDGANRRLICKLATDDLYYSGNILFHIHIKPDLNLGAIFVMNKNGGEEYLVQETDPQIWVDALLSSKA